MKVAVMQPYFFPYLGYFQLLHSVDVFVFFDCVQFPRRGWVHRNKFTLKSGELDWLTLPIIKGSRDETRIMDLKFKENSVEILKSQFENTQIFESLKNLPELYQLILNAREDVSSYLCSNIAFLCQKLGIEAQFFRSSMFDIPLELKGQDKILFILRELGAGTYLNLSGGSKLYSPRDFELRDIDLQILDPYGGPKISVLERFIKEGADSLREELRGIQASR